jgi:hypothetical protein
LIISPPTSPNSNPTPGTELQNRYQKYKTGDLTASPARLNLF